ncbi:Kinesin-like protein [Trichoderma simmonsii]|uniref:Kinesin-like protein n=1 Tax=Trichoderma simmonsii TaxID=1491479 RepID=A0A8G0PNY4_9HYPO|nr:Kinesin-like protein [Trichoderma simmonsii]
MDATENQAARPSKISRLPAPTAHAGGLTEWSESQQNARSQSSIPAPRGLKREIPPSAPQSEAKRRPLAERALDYPSKTPTSALPRSTIKGQSLANISQLKLPRPASTIPSASNSFARSFGPGRNGAAEKSMVPRPNTPANHTRSKSQVARPRTAQGFREEEDKAATDAKAFDAEEHVRMTELHFQELKKTVTDAMVHTTQQEKTYMANALDLVNKKASELESYKAKLESDKSKLESTAEFLTKRVSELESDKSRLEDKTEALKSDLDASKEESRKFQHDIEKLEWEHSRQIDDLTRKHKAEIDDIARQHTTAIDDLSRELERLKTQEAHEHQQQIDALNRRHQQELRDEQQKREQELQSLRSKMGNEQQETEIALQKKDREVRDMRSEAEGVRSDLQREKALTGSLQTSISELSASNTTLEAKINSLRSQVEFLESDTKAQSDAFAAMEDRLQDALKYAEEARQKLMKEETERRVLFNKYQELKGNIRVMCRVRPPLGHSEGQVAQLSYPDDKTSAEILVAGPEEKSSLGVVQRKSYPFEFDRVFTPEVQNNEIFDEISQMVQSALDGYNVCIFCYGQTGSGKTYTMSSPDGMIPRATHMIYDTVTQLKEKSWDYTLEGSFVEVYNEELNDLLTPNERTAEGRLTRKLEIRHDEIRKQTTIMGCKSVRLNSADTVELMLEEAQKNRSVAATKANERSSRSHSIFILKLIGENSATGERCEGTLNLVDLAGSERLKHSQVEGDRMKETQNINKSLSCLGDVIEALGRGSGHIPYRNSKLTHLLQYSLGGNSKTLMFVMVSPLETHLKETLTSLRFATKVHNTHIGTAKATKKIKGDL